MTRSPSSIRPKSAIASPVCRRMRLASLSASSFVFRRSFTMERPKLKTALEKNRTPAVHGEHLARNEGGGGEEVYRPRDLLGRAEARERRGGDDALALMGRKLAVFRPGNGTGGDGVDAHLRAELKRKRARERR